MASGPAALLHRRRPLATLQLTPPGLTGPTGGLASSPLPAKAPPNEPATGRETNCPGVFERLRPWFARSHSGSADRHVFPSGYWSKHLSSPFVFAAVRSVLDRPQKQADPLLGRAADRAVVPQPPVCVDIPAGRRPVRHYWGRLFAQPPAVGLPRGEPPSGLGVAAVICDGVRFNRRGTQRGSKVSLSSTAPVVL